MNKPLLLVLAALLLAATVFAFNPPEALVRRLDATDVTSIYAKSSFAEMLRSLPPDAAAQARDGGWSFSAPDGSATFFWNASGEAGEGFVARIATPVAPFVAAGLDVDRLPAGMIVGDMLVVGLKAGTGVAGPGTAATAEGAFARLVDEYRDHFGYHFQLEHFGLELDGGNMLEWAGDPKQNSLDLVFVLDPDVLVAAGVDPARVDGWVAGTVIVHAPENGRKIEVEKFLKPFDLQ